MIKNRKTIQIIISVSIFLALSLDLISLASLLIIGLVSGIIFGKVFCKWMCPMGLIMEFMKKSMTNEEKKTNMYNYYKLGCPISWIQGITNKYSLFKIQVDTEKCSSCGLCDKTCYITSINKETSFYKKNKTIPGEAFNCSKCLECTSICPSGSINFSPRKLY